MIDHERVEWVADALLDADDVLAWEQQRNEALAIPRCIVSKSEMIASAAAERKAVEASLPDGREWARGKA